MKKNVLYTVTKGNRPAFMPDMNVFDDGGSKKPSVGEFFENTVDKMSGWLGNTSNLAGSITGNALGAIGTAVGTTANKLISGKYNTGIGNGIANIGGAAGSLISKVNPILGGIVSAGSGILGGVWNAGFGVNYNEDVIKGIKNNASVMENAGHALAQANTNAGVLDAARNMGSAVDIDYHDLGSTGFLRSNNALRREKARLDKAQNLAIAKQAQGLMLGSNQADQTTDDLVAQDFIYANGGPLNPYGGALGLMQNDNYINAINNRSTAIMKANPFNTSSNAFGEGGGIHISPSKKGTFTAAASRHGMGVQEFASKVLANKDDYSPAMVKKANFARNAAKWHAFGGELGTNGTDWTNGLLFVDGGGTHQQNPLGGVPVGFDANGTPNLVEEGETIWNDYVFSDRIKVPKAMFHTLGLGGALKKGITFADASKKLARESEQRPNDPISMAGLDASLSKLAAVQEAERMKKQMREYVGLGNMAAFGGPVNRFEDGGDTDGYGEGSGGGGGAGSYFGKGYIKASINKKPYAIIINPDGVRVGYPIKDGKVDNSGKAIVINSDTPIEEGSSVNMKPAEVSEIPVSEVGNITYNAGMLPEVNSGIPERYNGPKDWGMFYSFNNPSTDVNTPELTVQGPSLYGTTERRNQPVDRAALNWVRQNYPDMDNAEDIANAISRIAKVNVTSRQFVQGANSRNGLSNNDYADAMRNILNGRGNLIAPEIGQLYTRNADRGREHFKYLQSVGIPDDVAFSIAFPEVPEYLNDTSNARHDIGLYNTMSSARNALYSELMNRNASPATQQTAITPDNTITPNEATSQYSSEEINNSTEPVSVEQKVPSYRLPETSVFNTPIDSYNLENMIMQAQNPGFTSPQYNGQVTAPRITNNQAGISYYPTTSGRGVAQGSQRGGINPYAYDNSRWNEFKYYNPQTRQYDEGYLNFAKNINQDWVDRILAGTYGDMSRYLSKNNGYRITPQEVGNLATDELYSDMHKAMQAAYQEYLAGIDPKTGEKIKAKDAPAPLERTPEGTSISSLFEKPEAPEIKEPDNDNGNNKPYKRLDTRLRYAPVWGSALSVLSDMFNTPDYTYPDKLEAVANAAANTPVVNAQPIGDYMRYSPFDRLFYANQLQANARATDRALGNTASPSAAAGMLANAYNTNNSLGNLYRQAEEYNLAQRQQTADFNRRTNMFNSQMGLEAALANARNKITGRGQQMQGLAQVAALRDAIDRQYSVSRSANLTNFFNNLGNIGRENFIFNQINNDPSRSYGYNEPWTGVVGYWPKFMEDQYKKWYDEQKKKEAKTPQVASATSSSTAGTSGAYGGRLKRNKK